MRRRVSPAPTRLGIWFLALAAPLWVVPGAASAADPLVDAENGRTVARAWCANCHAVERGERQRADGVPSFVALANEQYNTQDRLRAFLTRPHGRMPDLTLSRQERDDVIAYLLSLREGRATPVPADPKPRR